jgi:hypothetical protein
MMNDESQSFELRVSFDILVSSFVIASGVFNS